LSIHDCLGYRWIGKKDEKLTEVEETIRLSAIQNSHVVIPALVNNNLPTSQTFSFLYHREDFIQT
jgi:hypothetical protein